MRLQLHRPDSFDIWASYLPGPNALSKTVRQHVNMSDCEHMRNKTSGCHCLKIQLRKKKPHHFCGVRDMSRWGEGSEVLWRKIKKKWYRGFDFFGNGKPHSRIPLQSQHNETQCFLTISVISKWVSNNNKVLCLISRTVRRLGAQYYRNRWVCCEGLKQNITLTGDFAKASTVSSYCHTDWMKSRSDDIAAGSERRVYPPASRGDKGQWL